MGISNLYASLFGENIWTTKIFWVYEKQTRPSDRGHRSKLLESERSTPLALVMRPPSLALGVTFGVVIQAGENVKLQKALEQAGHVWCGSTTKESKIILQHQLNR